MSRSILCLVLGASALGCSSVGEKRNAAAHGVAALVHERTGFHLEPAEPGDGSLSAPARELLDRPLTEEAAIRIAMLNNRRVAVAFARLGVSSAELHQAGLLANPLLAANAKFFGGGAEVELGVSESLLDVFFLGARKRIAEAEFESARLKIAAELVHLVHDVRRSFASVRAAERLVEVEREVVRAAEASVELMTELHGAGNVTDPELTSEELALAQAKLALARAEAERVEAREPLNELLGLWGDSVSWSVEGSLQDEATAGLDLGQVESRAIRSSLVLAGLRAEATAYARRLGIVGWQAVLDPGEVGLAVKQETGSSDWGVGPAVGFSLPVFDTGSSRRAAASARLETALADHIATAVEIRSAARRLRERSAALSDQLRFIRGEELPRAKRLVRETLRNYNAMQIGAFEVFVARKQEIEAMRDYVAVLHATWLARIDLEELLAGSLNETRVDSGPGRALGGSRSMHTMGPH